jgi:hypothetical protein
MKFPTFTYPSVGQCVYCGSIKESLSDEHIIPLALDGSFILPEASCESCAALTSQFEGIVAKKIYGFYRIKKDFSYRRKKKRPKEVAAKIIDDETNKEKAVIVPISETPNLYPAWQLPPPGILSGIEPSNIIQESNLILKASNPETIKPFLDSISCGTIQIEQYFDLGAFLKQLAKIAHCYAFACTKGKGYQSLLQNIIIGKSEYSGHYVGGIVNDHLPDNMFAPLQLSIICNSSGFYLIVRIQLLDPGPLPPYQVVAGYIPDINVFHKVHCDLFIDPAIE